MEGFVHFVCENISLHDDLTCMYLASSSLHGFNLSDYPLQYDTGYGCFHKFP